MKKPYFIFLVLLVGWCFSSCGGSSPSDPTPINFGLAERGEELAGGSTTVFANTENTFTLFADNLTFSQQSDFKIGNSFFEQDWVVAPATTTARDGLGPLFNARACASCHRKDGRGAPPQTPDEESVALLIRLSVPGVDPVTGEPLPEPNYGGQFNPKSNAGIPAEGRVVITYQEIKGLFADGQEYTLQKPVYQLADLAYGAMNPQTMISPRVAPSMIGMGLLEAIPEDAILEIADPEDANEDGISGKPNYVWDVVRQTENLGRFGWKSNQPTVEQQIAAAFLGDIGITSSLFPDEGCMPSQIGCVNSVTGGSPEITDGILDFVVFYSQTLAVPARRNWTDPQVLAGKRVFHELGCASCHTPQFKTDANYPIAELAGQTIRPYTDLLLHDMGAALADNRPDFLATGREWRTPPLWGIGLVETVNHHTRFMHDGRARNLEEAVLWHGGEARPAQQKYTQLPQQDREALLAFLESL